MRLLYLTIKVAFRTFLVFGLLTIGCTIIQTRLDNDLKSNVKDFIKDMKIDKSRLKGYNIGFSDKFTGTIIGVCFYGFKKIRINLDFWKEETELRRKALVYHELGHCVCRQIVHNTVYEEDGCPASVMNAYIADSKCLKRHWNTYVKRLRKNCES